jgi:peptidyl-tRNA hydrolase
MEAKQVIAIRRDQGMRRGKEIAQGAHASMIWLNQRQSTYSGGEEPTGSAVSCVSCDRLPS